MDISTPAVVDTFFASFQLRDPPNITHISRNQTVNATDTVSLICSADGFPAPSITWTNVIGNNDVNVPLRIGGIRDEGYYRCTADNGIRNPAIRDGFTTVQSKSSCLLVCLKLCTINLGKILDKIMLVLIYFSTHLYINYYLINSSKIYLPFLTIKSKTVLKTVSFNFHFILLFNLIVCIYLITINIVAYNTNL